MRLLFVPAFPRPCRILVAPDFANLVYRSAARSMRMHCALPICLLAITNRPLGWRSPSAACNCGSRMNDLWLGAAANSMRALDRHRCRLVIQSLFEKATKWGSSGQKPDVALGLQFLADSTCRLCSAVDQLICGEISAERRAVHCATAMNFRSAKIPSAPGS